MIFATCQRSRPIACASRKVESQVEPTRFRVHQLIGDWSFGCHSRRISEPEVEMALRCGDFLVSAIGEGGDVEISVRLLDGDGYASTCL